MYACHKIEAVRMNPGCAASWQRRRLQQLWGGLFRQEAIILGDGYDYIPYIISCTWLRIV
jgi:hypothetical protein